MGRQASFDFIVIKSTKEKSRENHKQTNKQTKKVEEKAGTSRRKKSRGKKTNTKFAAGRSVFVKQFDYDSWIRLSLRPKFF